MNRLRQRVALRRFIGVALLAWVMGQWTVLAHSIAHGQAVPCVESSADPDHVWGHVTGTSACHIVDHLLAGQAPAGEPPTPPFRPIAALRMAVPPVPSIGPNAASRAYEACGPSRAWVLQAPASALLASRCLLPAA